MSMTSRPRPRILFTIGLGVTLALSLAIPALGVAVPRQHHASDTADSPPVTPRPETTPRPTRKPHKTPRPSTAPAPGPGGFVPAVPTLRELRVGYRDPGVQGRLPLVVAQERGYFRDAGFESVDLIEVEEPITGLLGGQLDVGVVDVVDAAEGVSQGLPMAVLAGFHNRRDGGATYGDDVLAASADLVANDPATITAFLTAYVRALQDIADPAAQDTILELAKEAGLRVTDEARAAYPSRVMEFAPFDGGFGASDQGGGLAELTAFLTEETGSAPDLSTLLAWPALLVAQASAGVPANPAMRLLEQPHGSTFRVAVPAGDPEGALAVDAAATALLADGPLHAIERVETDAPLTALLDGGSEAAVVPVADVAAAVAAGRPIAVLAGGRTDQEAGGPSDVLVVTRDLLAADPGSVTAFLIAYIGGLQELADTDTPGADAFAPFDGGFGERDDDGGLGALSDVIGEALGPDLALRDLIAWPSLVVAQTALGIAANPVASVMGTVDLGADDSAETPSPAPSAAAA